MLLGMSQSTQNLHLLLQDMTQDPQEAWIFWHLKARLQGTWNGIRINRVKTQISTDCSENLGTFLI